MSWLSSYLTVCLFVYCLFVIPKSNGVFKTLFLSSLQANRIEEGLKDKKNELVVKVLEPLRSATLQIQDAMIHHYMDAFRLFADLTNYFSDGGGTHEGALLFLKKNCCLFCLIVRA